MCISMDLFLRFNFNGDPARNRGILVKLRLWVPFKNLLDWKGQCRESKKPLDTHKGGRTVLLYRRTAWGLSSGSRGTRTNPSTLTIPEVGTSPACHSSFIINRFMSIDIFSLFVGNTYWIAFLYLRNINNCLPIKKNGSSLNKKSRDNTHDFFIYKIR